MGRPAGNDTHDPESVLAAAVGLFVERGYQATSMEEVARALGIRKSSIYHHVGGKEALLAASLDRSLDALEEATASARGSDEDAVEHLERLVRAVVHATVGPAMPHVTLLLRIRGNTEAGRAALRRRRRFDRELARLVRAAMDEGGLRDDLDPAAVARLFYGMVNSLTEWYRPGRGMSPEALADTVVAMLLDGLRPRGRVIA